MPRRRNWLDRINPVRWLENLIPTPKRRRARRPSPPPRPAPPVPPTAPPGGRGGGDPLRDIWREEGGEGSFRRARDFFDSLPADYATDDEEEEVFRDFVRYMVNGEGAYRRNSPDNPFWGSIGLHPQDFNWSEWRQVFYGGKHKTP